MNSWLDANFRKAVGDKKVYSKLQEAGAAFSTAGRRLRRKPEPEKHTGRRLAIGAALAGGAAFAVKKVKGGYLFVDFGTHDQLYRPWRVERE